ncbi:MAG TPA: hypothetical protein DEQ02_00100 [Ruminococcaceae bacterium]|nr:hypothetical protein [Oscillospiraceae bacterium]
MLIIGILYSFGAIKVQLQNVKEDIEYFYIFIISQKTLLVQSPEGMAEKHGKVWFVYEMLICGLTGINVLLFDLLPL